MADLTGMGVRWPLGGVGFGGDGGASVINNVTGALFKTAGMMEERKAADQKARAAEAARQQQLDQSAALGAWNQINTQMNMAGLPKAVQHQLYSSSRPIAEKLGFVLPEIALEEWQPNYTKLFNQATAVLGMPGTYEEKQQRLNAMLAEATNDPNVALIVKRQEDQLKAQRAEEVAAATNLAFRVLTNAATDEERSQYLAMRAIANSPDTPETSPIERRAKQERAVLLFDAERGALAEIDKLTKPLGKDTRMVQRDPTTGAMRETVPAAPPEPKEPKEPGTLVERIEQLQASGKPEDAARADRLLMLSDRTKQSMTINLPKTTPTEFIGTAQTVGLAARRLSRTVERFDESFVGILGKLKGLSTKFSDLPGIPAFAERKAFANDLIAMTNDVKKQLLGAARTVPELADLARFLPDPDQNLSVAEFKGNLETFIEGFVDVMDVLPGTLEEAGVRKPDFTKERKSLTGALEKLRGGGGPKSGASGMSDADAKAAKKYGVPPGG